ICHSESARLRAAETRNLLAFGEIPRFSRNDKKITITRPIMNFMKGFRKDLVNNSAFFNKHGSLCLDR
ncbi:MAG: hypothetical protein ACPGWR_07935, partial [Ardenticatenaceae bacterium]